MKPDIHLKDTALKLIAEIAPEADLERLDPRLRFRDQFDFDSIDFLNFAERLAEILEIKIPETDFPLLATLESCQAYLQARLGREAAEA
ncbi:MAG: acyl carrier protein [Desulfobacterales bacterium]